MSKCSTCLSFRLRKQCARSAGSSRFLALRIRTNPLSAMMEIETTPAFPITFCTKQVLRRLTRNSCSTHYRAIVPFFLSARTYVSSANAGALVCGTPPSKRKKTLGDRGIVLLSTKRSGRSTMYRRQVQNNETLIKKAAEYKTRRHR